MNKRSDVNSTALSTGFFGIHFFIPRRYFGSPEALKMALA